MENKAHLMTLNEYRDHVVPLLQEFKKFIKKNEKFLKCSSGLFHVTYDEYIYKTIESLKRGGHEILIDDKEYLDEGWVKYHTKEPIPSDIKNQYDELINKISTLFLKRNIELFRSDNYKSNKSIIRYAIDYNVYKDMLEKGEVSIDQITKICESVGIRVPKKLTSSKGAIEGYTRNIAMIINNNAKEFEESLRKQIDRELDVLRERYQGFVFSIIDEFTTSGLSINNFLNAKCDSRSSYSEVSNVIFTYLNTRNVIKKVDNFQEILDKKTASYVESFIFNFVAKVTNKFLVSNKNLGIPKIEINSMRFSRGEVVGHFRIVYENGTTLGLETEVILAGGHNIQILHERYLFKIFKDGIKISLKDIDNLK